MGFVFQFLGFLVFSFLVVWGLVGIYYKFRQGKIKAAGLVVDALAMPHLRPISIPSKGQRNGLDRIAAWMFEVREWELTEDWSFKLPNDGPTVMLHKGFVFDGASIPRPLWGVLSPTGLLLVPGVIHDYAYRYEFLWQLNDDGTVSKYKIAEGRECWDTLFFEVGKEVNGLTYIDKLAHYAVSKFGESPWENNRDRAEVWVNPRPVKEVPEAEKQVEESASTVASAEKVSAKPIPNVEAANVEDIKKSRKEKPKTKNAETKETEPA